MTYFSGLFIASCFSSFVLYVAIESFRIRDNEKRRFEFRFWAFAIVFILILIFRRWIDSCSGKALWRETMTLDILADIVTFLGLIVVIQSRHALGRSWSSEVVVQKKHELIERGPYAYIRHPMYSGLLLMLLGVAVYYGRPLWLLVFGFCLFALYMKSRREESLLTNSFPAYSEYKRRTKSLIPFVL
jgi:protein-S-isoprenylcysteine O-methyltransferase Ste14